MFQQNYSSGQHRQTFPPGSSPQQPKLQALDSGASTSIFQQTSALPSSSLPVVTVRRLDKDLLIEQLHTRIRELQEDLVAQQQQRKSQISLIKKHVEVLEKQMYFMGEENRNLGEQVKELRQYNGRLMGVLKDKENTARNQAVLAEYKPETINRRKSQVRTRKSSISSQGKVEGIKKKIKGLSKKIRASQQKLVQVRKAMR